ncbi:MAG: adenosylcobinamide-phosphate synthase CbiB [Pseudomonadota bacterium]
MTRPVPHAVIIQGHDQDLQIVLTDLMQPALLVGIAIVLDAMFGDPAWLYRRVPHPVVLPGRLIGWLDEQLNPDPAPSGLATMMRGGAAATLLVALALAAGIAVHQLLSELAGGWLLEAILASTLLAGRGLHDHVSAVGTGLARSLDDGREAVRHIVGRDPSSLDDAGVARAAIESAAENFVDGFVAPALWFALFGLPGLCAYKVINTLDSMIGHRTPRHERFGKVAARIDDVANWLPARVGAALILLAALPGRPRALGHMVAGIWGDAGKHRSMNAGWPEAAMAYALGIRLAGPRQYAGDTADDPWIGVGDAPARSEHIVQCLRVYRRAWGLAALLCVALAGTL